MSRVFLIKIYSCMRMHILLIRHFTIVVKQTYMLVSKKLLKQKYMLVSIKLLKQTYMLVLYLVFNALSGK